MAQIKFLPLDRNCECEEGDCLLDAALEGGVRLDHACGGDAVCSTCAVEILSGAENLSPLEEMELETLDKLLPDRAPQTRLACQAVLLGEGEGEIVVRVASS